MTVLNASYLAQNVWLSMSLMVLGMVAVLLSAFLSDNRTLSIASVHAKLRTFCFTSAVVGLPLLVAFSLLLPTVFLMKQAPRAGWVAVPRALALAQNAVYSLTAALLVGVAYYRRTRYGFSISTVLVLSKLTAIGAVFN